MPATSWTEATGSATGFVELVPGIASDAVIIMDIIMPITGGTSFPGAEVTWVEASQSATSNTEASLSALTSWTENSG